MTVTDTPKRILMATDLGARCDRALARAALLARTWHAGLVVAHVVHPAEVTHRERLTASAPSWRRPRSWVQQLQRVLDSELASEGIDARPVVIAGSTDLAVRQAAIDEAADLVVLGAAKDATMDRIQSGSTVDHLVRHSHTPVLNVRGRARSPYRHVVVATDFSAPALQALRLAARWFPDARLTLFHAYTPPGPMPGDADAASESWRATIHRQCDAHLAEAALPQSSASRLERILERGAPEALLADYAAWADVDLVVMGSAGRSGLSRALLGSTAENLLHALDCDTLVVRAG